MGGGGIPALQGSDGDCPQLCCRPKGKWGDRLGEKTRGRRRRERGRKRRMRRWSEGEEEEEEESKKGEEIKDEAE